MAEIVEQQGATYIFPKTIPKKRNGRDVTVKSGLSVVCIAVGVLLDGKTENKFIFLVNSLCYSLFLLVFVQVCIRICNLIEEFFHLKSRYDGNVIKMFNEAFGFDNDKYIIILNVVAVFCTILTGNSIKIEELNDISPLVSVFVGMSLFASVMKLEECSLNTAKLMDELKGLDYGSGMAYSFFYGYLNIMLPCTGDERKGLKEQIEDFESKNGVKFGTKKLYILIPLSAYCPTSLVDHSNCMDAGGSLDWRTLDRAGVKKRRYHNSVYKLWPEKLRRGPIYVCAEYATPLLTLHEVMRQDSPESRRYKKYQKEIVTNFYLTLHKILQNDRDCRDRAELIYYRGRYKKYQKEIVTNFYLTLHKILQNDRDCRDRAELIYYRGRYKKYQKEIVTNFYLTLHKILQNDRDCRDRAELIYYRGRYKKYQKEIVTNFYLTLHKILQNDRDCRDRAELIYYRDVDNNGVPVDKSQLDVGLLLLERVNQETNNTNNS